MRKHIFRIGTLTAVLLSAASGQTQVDLRTQSKSIDFSASSSTKPFQTGVSLPVTCSVGQMFFVSTGPAGRNTFGCTAPNTWTAESGGGTSSISVSTSGTNVGTASAVDLSGGTGLIWAVSNTGTEISAQTMLDTSVIQTRAGSQSGGSVFCNSLSTGAPGAAYTCSMTPTLSAYSVGMTLNWKPDASAAGGLTTLNVDNLGAVPLKNPDGATDPAALAFSAGQLYQLWYDGNAFRLVTGAQSGNSSGGGSGTQGPAGPPGPAGPTGPTGPAGPSGSAGTYSFAAGGYMFPFGFPTDNGTTGFTQAGIVKIHMFTAAGGMTISTVNCYVSDASGCSSGSPCGLAIGLYTSAGAVVARGATPIANSGLQSVTFGSPAQLAGGSSYYLAWAVDNPGVDLHAAGGGSWLFQILSSGGGVVRSGTALNGASGTAGSIQLPATLGTLIPQSGGYAIPPVVGFLF